MKVLIVQTRSFTQNESGVPRITYNLGKYFTEKGLDVAYFSFVAKGHISVEYGQLFHVEHEGSIKNEDNLNYLIETLASYKPDFVINQMPYEKGLRKLLYEYKENYDYKNLACIHNSLFSFKSNVKDIMKRKLPVPFNTIMATELMSKIPLAVHKFKHRKQLKEILASNDITFLYTPPNYEELKYFLNEEELIDAKIEFMPNPVVGICKEVPKKDKTILHVGTIGIQQKRSDLLLDFWQNTYKKLPDWKFQVVGKGNYLNIMKADLEKRKLPRIELLGFQNPDEYYKKASIFMMPSAYEGLPNTIIEANSYGCPILAFNSYAALEWIVNKNVDALLAKPFDTKQMSDLCAELGRNTHKLSTMQKAALLNAKRFDIETVGQQWLKLFEKLND